MSMGWRDLGDGLGLLLGPGGEAVARHSWTTAKNHPFFDQIRPLNHGGVVTNHAPHDHRWHHGLWWSWKFINDVLFWEDHPGYGGNRIGLGRSVVEAHEVLVHDESVRIQQRLSWRVEKTGEVLLEEERTVTAAARPELAGGWSLDWDHTWTPTTQVVLSTTPWPQTSWGGYAGLNYRAARSMAEGETILASGGRSGRDAVHGTEGVWGAYLGLVDGAELDEPDDPAVGGVAVLEHPDNPGFPNPLYAFSASDGFGFLSTAPLMHRDVVLEPGQDLRLRMRNLVLGATATAAELEAAHADYAMSRDRSAVLD